MMLTSKKGFPDGPVGKESSCSVRDPHSIPGSGRSAGEGIDYPLQYSWASLVAQLVKNLPAKQCQTFTFWGSKITADGDCSHEIKRRLLLGRKVMTNLDSILKSRDITLPTKVCLVKAIGFQ